MLDSDDYFYTDKFDETIDKLYNIDSDIIVVDNKVNNGEIWNDETRVAPWSYFIKNSFWKENNLHYDECLRRAGDWNLMQDINKINHNICHLHDVIYHYNYPRENSIVWNYEHNVIDSKGYLK